MGFLIFFLTSLAFGQQTTTRLDVVYSGSTPGRIRGFEQGLPKGNYIDLIWPDSLAANYAQTMPKSTGTLLSTVNMHYHDSQAFPVSAWRARGTEASPTNLSAGDTIFSFVGIGRVGGAWISLGSFGIDYQNVGGVDVGMISFATRNAGVVGTKVTIDHIGQILPSSSSQTLGTTTAYWGAAYFNGANPLFLDRAARASNQSALFTVAGASSGNGAWSFGMQPNSSESSFHITHDGTNRVVISENGQLDFSGPAINGLSAVASFATVNAVSNPAYRVGGTTIVDSSRNATFVNLTITGACTGCPAGSPPVDWWLDSGSTVVTLGNHGTVAASQMVTKFSRGTHTSPTNAADTDQVFGLKMQYYADGAYRDSAAIFAYASATPSGSSSPGKLSFFVTPTGSTSGVERFYIDDTESWFSSSMPGNYNLHIKNTSSSGFSGAYMYSHDNSHSGFIGWGNSGAALLASTFHIGTHSSDNLAIVTTDTVRWLFSAGTGTFTPNTDNGPSFGSFAAKPAETWSREYNSYSNAAYGTQQHDLTSDANLNFILSSFSSASATDRGSFQMHRYRGSISSPATTVNGDRLGNIAWQGYTSGGLGVGAVIEAYAANTVSSGVVPAEIRFRTTNAGGTLADRMTILADGDVNMGYGLSVTGVVNSAGSPAYRVGGQTVIDASRNLTTGSINPITGATYDIGSTSGAYASIYAATALYVYTGGITRFSASGSGILVYTSGGANTFSVTASSGAISGGTVLPIAASTYDVGSTSVPYNSIYGNSVYGLTALYVLTSGVTRFAASGGGISVYSSGGANTFGVTASSGNVITSGTVSAGSGYIAGGNSGLAGTTLSVRDAGGGADCTITIVGGIVTASTC